MQILFSRFHAGAPGRTDRRGSPSRPARHRRRPEARAPQNSELAIGSVASDGTIWLNDSLIAQFGVDDASLEAQIERERQTAQATVERYRGDRPSLDVDGKRVVVVDDGVATGATTIACLRQIRAAGADYVILAVPVAPLTRPNGSSQKRMQ